MSSYAIFHRGAHVRGGGGGGGMSYIHPISKPAKLNVIDHFVHRTSGEGV